MAAHRPIGYRATRSLTLSINLLGESFARVNFLVIIEATVDLFLSAESLFGF